jgi:hypothetical protein
MTIYTAPDPKLLAQMADEVGQLIRPFTLAVRQSGRKLGRTRWTAITHPPLLTQLSEAALPTGSSPRWDGGARHTGNPLPINVPAADALDAIMAEIGDWRWRIIPTHHAQQHWATETLLALVGAAPNLAPSIAAELATDVHSWWRSAAVYSGWNPEDLRCPN